MMRDILAPILSSILLLSRVVVATPVHITIDVAGETTTTPNVLFPPTSPSIPAHAVSNTKPLTFLLQATKPGGKPVFPSAFLGYSHLRVFPPRIGLGIEHRTFEIDPEKYLFLDGDPVAVMDNGGLYLPPIGPGEHDEIRFRTGEVDGMQGKYLIVDKEGEKGPPQALAEFWAAGRLELDPPIFSCAGKGRDCTADKTKVFFKVLPQQQNLDLSEATQQSLSLEL